MYKLYCSISVLRFRFLEMVCKRERERKRSRLSFVQACRAHVANFLGGRVRLGGNRRPRVVEEVDANETLQRRQSETSM